MLEREWRKGNPLHCWWKCKLKQPQWRIVWMFFNKPKAVLPYILAIPFLGIYSEKTIMYLFEDTCTLMFTSADNLNVHQQYKVFYKKNKLTSQKMKKS